MGENIDNPKVSVIIPIYNTGEYVEEAVCSIMNQTLSDLEIIIINDGSTDNSLHIVTQLQNKDSRITIYSQENKGLSAARNKGLSYAIGDYIYFMDSDDILTQNALKTCFDKCSVCLLFIDRSYLDSLSLDFLPGIIHEDQLFTAKLFTQAQKVAYIPETFFYRRLRPGSIMTKNYSIVNVRNYFIVVNELIKFASNQNEDISKTIHKTIQFIFDPAIYLANKLKWNDRFSIAKTCFIKYRKYISMKSWLVLLFPWLIKLKSYTK